jgi:hypothetical protein
MKKIISLIFIFQLSFHCLSQNTDGIIIKKKSSCYYLDINNYCSFLYEIENKSNNTFYLWIEEDIHTPELERIKDYFEKNKGDMNLYQMAMERLVTYAPFALYYTFLKKLNPQEKFSIYVLSMEEISDNEKEEVFTFLDEHLVIVKENILEQQIKALSNFNPQIFYKDDYIILPISVISSSLKK